MVNQTFEKKNRYKDFDLSFSKNPLTGDLAKKTDANAISQSMKNLLFTSFYERPFRPRVGSNIRKILFEPADYITMGDLRAGIEETIINYEPRVLLDNIDIVDMHEQNAYSVTVVYRMNKLDDAKSINITLKRLR